jgi:glutamyl-tRNA(Gln) amidotransferase subunit D
MDKANFGDKVNVVCDNEELIGVLMPNKETDSVVIKLNSGYNIGIDKNRVKKTEVIEKAKLRTKKESKIKNQKNKKKIMILHTGGTIASKVDYSSGGVIAQFSPADLIEMVPEIGDIVNIDTELVANMMSEDICFKDYQKLAKAIKKHIENGIDGIIIGHGTDTLAYTSSALSFMLEGINLPVILVGSQRSSDRGSSDARINLICASIFINQTDFAGVAICMHNSTNDNKCAILPATKTRKMHTSRRDAFKAVNDTPIAVVDYNSRKIEYLKSDYSKKSEYNKLVLRDKFNENVGLLKTHTNMKSDIFEFFTKNYEGFCFEATGLGQAPTNLGDENLKNYELLKKFTQKNGIVVLTSQCIFGRVHPTVYTNCRRLSSIGIVYCEDMLPETAFIKLAWLLGNYKDKKEVKKLMITNLRGELVNRSEESHFNVDLN